MGTVYRPTVTRWMLAGKQVKAGTPGAEKSREKSPTWWGRWVDAAGKPHQEPLAKTEKAARLLMDELEVDKRRGHLHLPALSKTAAALGDLESLFVAFLDQVGARVSSEVYRGNLGRYLRRVAGALDWRQPGQIDADALANLLADWRRQSRGEGRKGLAAKSSNHYLRAWKQFTRWLAAPPRRVPDSLGHLQGANAAADPRHVRRALSPEDLANLLDKTGRSRVSLHGLNGKSRRRLYLFACLTGLRASELASLTADSFDLAAATPFLVVEARYSKHRRRDVLPLHQALAAELMAWKPIGKLWPGQWASGRHGHELMKHDLAAAEIPYRLGGRVFDFHALRGQFATDLARSPGSSPTHTQKLMRHSNPALTSRYYTHLETADLAAALHRVALPTAPASPHTHPKASRQQPSAKRKKPLRKAGA